MWAQIERLKGRITVILTTHYLEEAEALADRIGIMSRGRMQVVGTVEEIKRGNRRRHAGGCVFNPDRRGGAGMRTMAFAARNAREIVRDPLSALFGIGFPVVLILLISMMKRSVPEMPAEMFGIAAFTPGMAVFGLSFPVPVPRHADRE